ncbi:MAG: hypothetical protein ACLVIY_14315 [Anaerobutyricum soehngenii]
MLWRYALAAFQNRYYCFRVLRCSKRKKREKEQQLYQKGFQDLLQSLLTSLQAGYSLNNSCRIALRELESLYEGEQNPMLGQMRRIVQGIDLHIALEQLFMDFAERTESGGSKTVCGCDRDCAKYRWERSGDFEKDNAALEV